MKYLVAFSLLFASTTAMAFEESIYCTFNASEDGVNTSFKLDGRPGDDYEEERSEYYNGSYEHLNISVDYLPFQDGIYLNLSDEVKNVYLSTTNKDKAELLYRSDENFYWLQCVLI